MKRIISLILVVLMLISLVACGTENSGGSVDEISIGKQSINYGLLRLNPDRHWRVYNFKDLPNVDILYHLEWDDASMYGDIVNYMDTTSIASSKVERNDIISTYNFNGVRVEISKLKDGTINYIVENFSGAGKNIVETRYSYKN